jgi:hypothetical protein
LNCDVRLVFCFKLYCGPKGRDSIAQAEGLGMSPKWGKMAQWAVTSGCPNLIDR